MSILAIVEKEDKRLRDRIHSLEEANKALMCSDEKFRNRYQSLNRHHFNLLMEMIEKFGANGLPGNIVCPPDLEFDGRDFREDVCLFLKNLKKWRELPQIKINTRASLYEWKQYALEIGRCNQLLDREEGFINCESSSRKMTNDEIKIHLEKRQIWIKALLEAVEKLVD